VTQPSTTDPRLAAFLDTYQRERAITLKVLRAFPPEQSELKPHERSSRARQLAWTFVIEERLMILALREGAVLGGFAPPPDSWDAVLAQFEAQERELVEVLRTATAEQLGRTVQFFVGPKQLGDYEMMDFLWFLLHDQIHHRGQLSVYLRMAGGKVPSIYGPTADEPWS
jgi:uncharacterized damage-inducible protein DinB